MSNRKIKYVQAEYIESGTFQGSESEVFASGIKYGETCIVLRKKDFEKIKELAWRYEELCK